MYKCFNIYEIKISLKRRIFDIESIDKMKSDEFYKRKIIKKLNDDKAFYIYEYFNAPLFKYLCIDKEEYKKRFKEAKVKLEQSYKEKGWKLTKSDIDDLVIRQILDEMG